MRKFARVVPILSSYTRGTDLKAQINVCMHQNPPETPSQRGIYFTFSRGVFTCRTNNERSRCVQLPLAYSLSGYGCVPSTQHRPTYPFPSSLCLSLSFSLFSRKGKISGINLNLPSLEATWHRQRAALLQHSACAPIWSSRELASASALEAPQIPTIRDPPTPRRPEQGR